MDKCIKDTRFPESEKKRNNNEEESEHCGVGLKPAAWR